MRNKDLGILGLGNTSIYRIYVVKFIISLTRLSLKYSALNILR